MHLWKSTLPATLQGAFLMGKTRSVSKQFMAAWPRGFVFRLILMDCFAIFVQKNSIDMGWDLARNHPKWTYKRIGAFPGCGSCDLKFLGLTTAARFEEQAWKRSSHTTAAWHSYNSYSVLKSGIILQQESLKWACIGILNILDICYSMTLRYLTVSLILSNAESQVVALCVESMVPMVHGFRWCPLPCSKNFTNSRSSSLECHVSNRATLFCDLWSWGYHVEEKLQIDDVQNQAKLPLVDSILSPISSQKVFGRLTARVLISSVRLLQHKTVEYWVVGDNHR